MQPLFIRLATENDAAVIADLSRLTFYETFARYNTKEDMDKFMNQQFTRQLLMQEVGAPGNIFFLAMQGQEPVGYARLRESPNPASPGRMNAIEIARIYTRQSVIGTGIGSRLMQCCLDKAVELKKEIIWLGVWEKNTRAIAFYTKWGFEKFGEHPFILGDDLQTDWLMKKTLTNS
jgi:ribosomal protein S18 acetylase RimI-like enzyme